MQAGIIRTQLVDLSGLLSPKVDGVRLLAKAEYTQPGYSMKDRIAEHILTHAKETGKLRVPGGTVVAASSGNTGASVAMWCARNGVRAVILTDLKCSPEKKDAIRAYGADLRVAQAGQNYMVMEVELAKENPDWFAFDQYNNPQNPEAHYRTTGKEIWEQTEGKVTHFVMAASTGGTISGVSRALKEKNPSVHVRLADPDGSALAHFVRTSELVVPAHRTLVEGAGKTEVPGAFNKDAVDDAVTVTDRDAFAMCHRIAQTSGLLVGGSSGVNVHAAVELANAATEPCTIVTLLCDSGIKYLSKVYNPEWLRANNVDLETSPPASPAQL